MNHRGPHQLSCTWVGLGAPPPPPPSRCSTERILSCPQESTSCFMSCFYCFIASPSELLEAWRARISRRSPVPDQSPPSAPSAAAHPFLYSWCRHSFSFRFFLVASRIIKQSKLFRPPSDLRGRAPAASRRSHLPQRDSSVAAAWKSQL